MLGKKSTIIFFSLSLLSSLCSKHVSPFLFSLRKSSMLQYKIFCNPLQAKATNSWDSSSSSFCIKVVVVVVLSHGQGSTLAIAACYNSSSYITISFPALSPHNRYLSLYWDCVFFLLSLSFCRSPPCPALPTLPRRSSAKEVGPNPLMELPSFSFCCVY